MNRLVIILLLIQIVIIICIAKNTDYQLSTILNFVKKPTSELRFIKCPHYTAKPPNEGEHTFDDNGDWLIATVSQNEVKGTNMRGAG